MPGTVVAFRHRAAAVTPPELMLLWGLWVHQPALDGAICVGLFDSAEDAITEALDRLAGHEGFFIEPGQLTRAEWEALDEVPDDFEFPVRAQA